MDQGLGLGTASPFFNRHLASLTRFIPLWIPKATSTAAPPVFVLHGRYGGVVGDMASYDTFTMGGPHSVRPRPRLNLFFPNLLQSFYGPFLAAPSQALRKTAH